MIHSFLLFHGSGIRFTRLTSLIVRFYWFSRSLGLPLHDSLMSSLLPFFKCPTELVPLIFRIFNLFNHPNSAPIINMLFQPFMKEFWIHEALLQSLCILTDLPQSFIFLICNCHSPILNRIIERPLKCISRFFVFSSLIICPKNILC